MIFHGKKRKAVTPAGEITTGVFILNEKTMFHRVTEGLGEQISVSLGEALGGKSLNIPVGSHRNPFWRAASCLSSPGETSKILSRSLVVACSLGSAQLVRNLLDTGADPTSLPGEWGAIHAAAYHGDVGVLRVLLGDPRTQVNVPERKGRSAAHLAAWKGNSEAMQMLLQEAGSSINATDQCGNTPLHLAVSSPLQGETSGERFLQCISALLDRTDLALNLPDRDGLTALGRAMMLRRETIVRTILAHRRHLCNVDTFLAGYFGPTIRETVLASYPGLVGLLPPHLKNQVKSCKLLVALLEGELSTFKSLLHAAPELAKRCFGEPLHSTLPEVACMLEERSQFLVLLLEAGANPNAVNPVTMLPLLHMAARRGNAAALEVLLKAPDVQPNATDCFRRTPLHYLTQVQCAGSKDTSRLQSILNLILARGAGADVNATTASGETPLHVAARLGDEQTVLVLLKNGADIMFSTSGLEPPLAHIAPDVIERFLDESIEGSDEAPTHEDFTVTFRYNALLQGRKSEMAVLRYLSRRAHLRHLLTHPTTSSLLYLKWQRVKKFYIIHFILYCVFLTLLTWYSLLIGKEDAASQRKILGSLLCAAVAVLILREAMQFITAPRLYIRAATNAIQVAVLVATTNLCVWTDPQAIPQCSALALLLSWMQFVILIGGFPMLSVPLEMLRSVAWTSLRFMACYCPLLFAFAFSFYVMFRTQEDEADEDLNDFPTIGQSMLKTFVMFAGEFEAADVEFQKAPYTSHVVFVVFVFLMSIVLLNLLNGLAVSDTQSIRANAEILSLTARVKLVTYLEAMNSCVGMTRRWFSVTDVVLSSDKTYTVFPNRPKGYRQKWRSVQVDGAIIRNGDMDPEIVARAVDLIAERNKGGNVKDEFGNRLAEQVNDLSKRFEEMERKLEVILSHLCHRDKS